jgi:Na+-transporting NADH:ubiquinone oxidoreductase subunit C
MRKESPQKALIVVLAVALICSVLVSVSAVTLRPIQERNALVERSRNIIGLTGLVVADGSLSDNEILSAVDQLDIRLVEVDSGIFSDAQDAATYDARAARNMPELSSVLDPADDIASIGRRENFVVIYLVWDEGELQRVILPVYGQGMWSTLYGYIALESDLNTIAAISFYEQAETAGLGDQVQNPDWLAGWVGRRVFDTANKVRFRVAGGLAASEYEVDAMSGATVTGDAVTRLIQFWFGPDGYLRLIEQLRSNPPVQTGGSEA